MIEIRVPKEILHYKEKLVLNLSLRQVVASIIAIVVAIPTYAFSNQYLGGEVASWATLLAAGIPALFGFYAPNDMPLEKYLEAVISSMFIFPEKRIYAAETIYDYILFELKREGEEIAKEAARPQKTSTKKTTGKKKNTKNGAADDTVHANIQ